MSMELMVVAPVILQHKRAIPKSTQLVNAHLFLKSVGPLWFNYEKNGIKHSRLSLNDDPWGSLC
ncbi:hypothetical protein, partial [Bifidobacterium animalis]|uniref:hypothetical protein n=1 Tax=Bifidobacterium animalis TaxID=28025 RepID=UPI00319844BF